MPCLWHGLRMGETGEPRTGGGKQRTGRSRAMADIMPVVGRAAFRRFGFVQSSVVSRWPEIVGDRYAEVSAPDSIRFPSGERDGGTLTLVVEGERSEEHTSELQSLMRISYAVFCLKK